MAKLSKPTIPLKLYKHFAVVTLVMTAAIAMFADSDHRHVQAQTEVLTVREAAQVAQNELPRLIGADEIRTLGSFGSEGGSYGAPTVSAAGNSSYPRPASAVPAGRVSVKGYDQAWIDAMSEEEYAAFLEAIPTEMRDGETEAERRASFQRAAERRSGHRGTNGDEPA